METDLELNQFKQLEHDYIGYQSLTDVPKALSYEEDVTDYSVSKYSNEYSVLKKCLQGILRNQFINSVKYPISRN